MTVTRARTISAPNRRWWFAIGLAVLQGACSETKPAVGDQPPEPTLVASAPPSRDTAIPVERVRTYPRGRWRLGSPSALARTMYALHAAV